MKTVGVTCAVCHRMLRNAESMKRGIGPVCERKRLAKQAALPLVTKRDAGTDDATGAK